MKTQLPEKLECHAGTNCFHIKSPDSYILKTIDDRESSQRVCEAIVSRYNAHSQLVKERDELLAALHECVQDLESNAENLFQLSKNTLSGHLHANRQEASRRLQSIVSLLSTLKPVEQGANHSICLEVGKFSPNNEAVALAFQIHDDAKVLHSLGNYKDWKGVRVQIAKMRGAIDYCEILMGNKGKK